MFSPQSQSIVDKLIENEPVASGKSCIPELSDDGKQLLNLVIENLSELAGLKGDSRIDQLLTIVQNAVMEEAEDVSEDKQHNSTDVEEIEAESPVEENSSSPKEYRLYEIECTSFRGLAPAGETVAFDFSGQSNLIYGPNGSGKSSLLGAVIWVFTGHFINDFHDDGSDAKIYKTQLEDKPLKKLADWNMAVTLPEGPVSNNTAQKCIVEVELVSSEGDHLLLKRSLANGLEYSLDCRTWQSCTHLSEVGLTPLDLELSFGAPAELSRFTVENAKSIPEILALLLGYQDLIELGKLAGVIATNRTAYKNKVRSEIGQETEKLRETLRKSSDQFDDVESTPETLLTLAAQSKAELEQIHSAGLKIKGQIEAAQLKLASLMGLELEDDSQLPNLSDDLLKAISVLEKETESLFPSLFDIRSENCLSREDDETAEEQLARTEDEFTQFIRETKNRIDQRYQWWLQERESQGRIQLLLRAAEFFAAEENICPVCEQEIQSPELREELLALKEADQELRDKLATFFNNLTAELNKIVPIPLRSIATKGPSERLRHDWEALNEKEIPESIQPIFHRSHPKVEEVLKQISYEERPTIQLLPNETSEDFENTASDFLAAVNTASRSLGILTWSQESLASLFVRLEQHITSNSTEDKESLHNALLAGRDAADEIKPLQRSLNELRTAHGQRKHLAELEELLEIVESWEAPLQSAKQLKKYAENEVGSVQQEISQQTLEYWKTLYPETSTGLKPYRLEPGRKQTEGVQAFLANDHCVVPEAAFANTGLQRAVALSLYFALLDNHPRGLGFVVMDDPILSLDDDHRESWSSKILKPRMMSTQFIIATHQRHFYNNCRDDFSGEAVVEINYRSWPRSISVRPGNRLAVARSAMENAWSTVPNQIRQYCECAMRTLETFSLGPFCVANNFTSTIDSYRALPATDPLTSEQKTKMADFLTRNEVKRVLNPGSHGLSAADVTKSMVEECLNFVGEFHHLYEKELARLERDFVHSRRKTVISTSVEQFSQLPSASGWDSSLEISFFGSAAAKSEMWEINFAEVQSTTSLLPGNAVLCCNNSLEPVARAGQWILLADDEAEIRDGDLVAADCTNNDRVLRRITSNGDQWILKSINPIHPIPDICIPKSDVAPRRVTGVLYEPAKNTGTNSLRHAIEWSPRNDFDVGWLSKLAAVKVVESSLDPIARNGQYVLIDNSQAGEFNDVRDGSLAVIDSEIDGIGRVIKRVYHLDGECLLLSPNSVDPHAPLKISAEKLHEARFWVVRGVLFDTDELQD